MTDVEIIKALECCTSDEDWIKACKKCPLTGECKIGNGSILDGYALDLIKRQRKENERLQRHIEGMEDRIYALNDTNKLLMDSQEDYVNNRIKEFAERLKQKQYTSMVPVVSVTDIDDLVKEMTEAEA